MAGDASRQTVGEGLSVVVVSWNTRDLLVRLLQQLQQARAVATRPLQVIVVDNASQDGSAAAAIAVAADTVVLPQTRNLGFAAGVNRGCAVAVHANVLLLNPDVLFAPPAIEQLARYADAWPRAAIIGPRILDAQGEVDVSCWRAPSLRGLTVHALGLARLSTALDPDAYGRMPSRPTPVECVSGCVMLVRRQLLEELGGLDERFFLYFEEIDLCVRALQHGAEVHYAPVADFVHERGGASRTASARAFADFQRSRLLYFAKHRGRTGAWAARGLSTLWHLVRVPALVPLAVRRSGRARLALHWRALFGGSALS